MRRLITILSIAFVHFMVAIAAALSTFEVSGFMFGVYPPPNDGLLHRSIEVVYATLMFPFGRIAESLGPGAGLFAWPLVVLNSLLWAVVIYALAVRLRGRARHHATGLIHGA